MENAIQKQESNAIQQVSPVISLADKLAEGEITAEQMEKMLDLQFRWEKNEAEKAYNDAMSAMKAEIPSIIKTKQGHNNKYASLADIVAVISPVLSKYGLSHDWATNVEDGKVFVTCFISHRQGHKEAKSSFSSKPDTSGGKNEIQAIGSAITYGQRYTLRSALGIAEADQDDDGVAAGGKPNDIPGPNPKEIAIIDLICDKLPKKDGKVPNWEFIKKCVYVCNGGKYMTEESRVSGAVEWLVREKSDDQLYKDDTRSEFEQKYDIPE